MYSKFYTQSSTRTIAPSLHFLRIFTVRTPAHHFNESCLTILSFDFLLKIKTWSLQLDRRHFQVRHQNLLLFDLFLSDFDDSRPILTRIVSRIWTCFRNQNLTIVARTAIFSVRHWISAPNWAGKMTHRVIFFGGGAYFHCHWYDGTSKSTQPATMSDMT